MVTSTSIPPTTIIPLTESLTVTVELLASESSLGGGTIFGIEAGLMVGGVEELVVVGVVVVGLVVVADVVVDVVDDVVDGVVVLVVDEGFSFSGW